MKYLFSITIQIHPTQIVEVYFFLKNRILEIIGAQNQFLITFCSNLVYKRTLKATNSALPPHTNF